MSLDYKVTFGTEEIGFRLQRSHRRTLAITVQPDLSVVVTAPRKAGVETVLARVRKKAGWIRQQQLFFGEFLPPTPPRQYVSGETHRYLGRQYRLKIVETLAVDVKLKGQFIWVHTPSRSDTARVRRLVEDWYLARAKERLSRSFLESVARMGTRLTNAPRIQVRRMRKRWGSWTRRGIVYLNPELVRMPLSCIDYVVTHELCHAIYPYHGREFYALLKRVMPDWVNAKARLEQIAST